MKMSYLVIPMSGWILSFIDGVDQIFFRNTRFFKIKNLFLKWQKDSNPFEQNIGIFETNKFEIELKNI